MKITGTYALKAPRERVWPLIFDPGTLMGLIPGCEQIEQDGPDAYRGAITLRLPAVSGTYRTAIRILDRRAPEMCRLEGEASGSGGSVRGQAAFVLKEAAGGTLVEYEGDAVIAGPLAGMNPRFVEGVAQTLIRQGLARLDAQALAALPTEAPAARSGLWARFTGWLRRLLARLRG